MIRPIKFLPTVFKITPEAKNIIKQNQDNGYLYLGAEILRATFEPVTVKKENFLKKLFSFANTRTQLTIILDKNAQDDLVLKTQRKINKLILDGKSVLLDMHKLATTPKESIRVLLKSKEGILDQLNFIKKR